MPSPAARSVVLLLEADPDLGSYLDDERLRMARGQIVATLECLKRGEWRPCPDTNSQWALGALVLDGFLARAISFDSRRGLSLAGPGDVIDVRPGPGFGAAVDYDDRWLVLTPARVALLDHSFELSVFRWPPVLAELLARSSYGVRTLALQRAVAALPLLSTRLMAFLWFLADRWGFVDREGVVVPLRLSHGVLAELIGAARPSVTLAVHSLLASGEVAKRPDGRLTLVGDCPRLNPTGVVQLDADQAHPGGDLVTTSI